MPNPVSWNEHALVPSKLRLFLDELDLEILRTGMIVDGDGDGQSGRTCPCMVEKGPVFNSDLL